jgi:hypothetical protein
VDEHDAGECEARGVSKLPPLTNGDVTDQDYQNENKNLAAVAAERVTNNSPRKVRTISFGSEVKSAPRKKPAAGGQHHSRRSARTRSFDEDLGNLDERASTSTSEAIPPPVSERAHSTRRRSITSLTNQPLALEELSKPNQKVSNKLKPVSEKEAKQPRNVIMHGVGRRLGNMAMSAGIKSVINKQSNQMDEFLKELSQKPA